MFEQLNKEALLKLYPEYKKIYFGTNPDERRLVYLVGASSRTTLTLAKALVEVMNHIYVTLIDLKWRLFNASANTNANRW